MAKDLFEDESTEEGTDSTENNGLEVSSHNGETDEILTEDEEWVDLDENEIGLSLSLDEDSPAVPEDDNIPYEDIGEAYADDLGLAKEVDELIDNQPAPSNALPTSKHEKPKAHVEKEHSEKRSVSEKAGRSGKDEEPEVPPWQEMVEIPDHGSRGLLKQTTTLRLVVIIVFFSFALVCAYMFFQYRQLSDRQVAKLDEIQRAEENKIKGDIRSQEEEGEKETAKQTVAIPPATPRNEAPFIQGTPESIAMVGEKYSFSPLSGDVNAEDKLTFFISNQPAWTTFDLMNGSLSGIPQADDVGVYQNIAILVSDGNATTALPPFTITVKDSGLLTAHENAKEQVPAEAVETPVKSLETTAPPVAQAKPPQDSREKNLTETTEAAPAASPLPDLTDLLRQSAFRDAALEYHRAAKKLPRAFSLRLEVDCSEESVRIAFEKGDFDPNMFILPKKIGGRNCYVVCWGIYSNNKDAIKALSELPEFFVTQESKPALILVQKYL